MSSMRSERMKNLARPYRVIERTNAHGEHLFAVTADKVQLDGDRPLSNFIFGPTVYGYRRVWGALDKHGFPAPDKPETWFADKALAARIAAELKPEPAEYVYGDSW